MSPVPPDGGTVDGDADALLTKLRAFEGMPSGPPMEARDEVNQAMIRHWIDAMGDENPVYVDDEAARANGFPAWSPRPPCSRRGSCAASPPTGRELEGGAAPRGEASTQEKMFAISRRSRVHIGGGHRTASRSTSAPSSSATG